MSPRRGFLTLATGHESFLEMAVDMALSLREHTTLPVGVATDPSLEVVVHERFPAVFDEITPVGRRFLEGRVRKYGLASASPFDEAVFVDADCLVLGSLDHLFDALREHDVAMLGEQLTRDDDENHHGFSTRRLMERFDLDRYLKTNSGVFAFRREPALEVMEAWRICFLEEVRPRLRWSILLGRWLGDELAIGIVGGRRRLGTLPLPHVMYWPHEFDDLDLDAPAKPLLHFIWPPPPEAFTRLMRDVDERRMRHGLPTGSRTVWTEEVERLIRMKRRRLLLERIGWW